jgi:hypothetical protein
MGCGSDYPTDMRHTGLDYYQFTIVSEVKTKTNNIVGYKICVVKLPVSCAELST